MSVGAGNTPPQPFQQFEVQTWIAPLGMRFWDALEECVISDGLSVTAYPTPTGQQDTRQRQERRVCQAFPNRSGVYVLRNLPGLGTFERGTNADAAQFLAGEDVPSREQMGQLQGASHHFTVEVVDTFGRFQPFSLGVTAPMRGLFTWTCDETQAQHGASPPVVGSTLVPLFSTPTRRVRSGLAVVRATLWDGGAQLPAAWAMLEASIADKPIARGFADRNGQVALFFPCPAPALSAFDPSGTPVLDGGRTSLSEQTWTVHLQAYYTRQPASEVASPPQSPPQDTREGAFIIPRMRLPYHGRGLLPDLCATLQQAAAQLWSDAAGTLPLTGVTLRFGQELVVRSGRPQEPALHAGLLLISPVA